MGSAPSQAEPANKTVGSHDCGAWRPAAAVRRQPQWGDPGGSLQSGLRHTGWGCTEPGGAAVDAWEPLLHPLPRLPVHLRGVHKPRGTLFFNSTEFGSLFALLALSSSLATWSRSSSPDLTLPGASWSRRTPSLPGRVTSQCSSTTSICWSMGAPTRRNILLTSSGCSTWRLWPGTRSRKSRAS